MTITDQTPELAEVAGWTEAEIDAYEEDAETANRNEQLDEQREQEQEDGMGAVKRALENMTIAVWDVDRDEVIEVTPAECAAGMMRYARSLGPGTPACGVWERRALELSQSAILAAAGLCRTCGFSHPETECPRWASLDGPTDTTPKAA